MIACTVIIILTLVRSSTRSGSTSARRSRRRRNISVMLITVNLVFISLTAPIVIFLSIYEYVKDETNYYRQTILILTKVFCIILMNLNHSVNIIIYSVTAKEFRTEMTNFLKVILYCMVGKPVNPNDFSYMYDDGTIFARLRRLRNNLFKCCRMKMRSNSTNTTESSGLQHTTVPGMNNRSSKSDAPCKNKITKHKQNNRKSSGIRFSEASIAHRGSHRLTVQLQHDAVSSVFEREDMSLHGQSNSTED
jgi:hypothetical protein